VKKTSSFPISSSYPQSVPKYAQQSSGRPDFEAIIDLPTVSGAQWLDAESAGGSAIASSASQIPLNGDETDLPLLDGSAGDAAQLANQNAGGGNQPIFGNIAAQGNLAGGGPVAIEHVDSGGKVVLGDVVGSDATAAELTVDNLPATERGTEDITRPLEERIILSPYHVDQNKKQFICSNLFSEEVSETAYPQHFISCQIYIPIRR